MTANVQATCISTIISKLSKIIIMSNEACILNIVLIFNRKKRGGKTNKLCWDNITVGDN